MRKPYGTDGLATFFEHRYSEDQPRDEKGRFGEGSGEGGKGQLEKDLNNAGTKVAKNEVLKAHATKHEEQAGKHIKAQVKAEEAGDKEGAAAHHAAALSHGNAASWAKGATGKGPNAPTYVEAVNASNTAWEMTAKAK